MLGRERAVFVGTVLPCDRFCVASCLVSLLAAMAVWCGFEGGWSCSGMASKRNVESLGVSGSPIALFG